MAVIKQTNAKVQNGDSYAEFFLHNIGCVWIMELQQAWLQTTKKNSLKMWNFDGLDCVQQKFMKNSEF